MSDDATQPPPRTSVDLGLMQGAPPPPERLVTSDNWIEGPFNRWGFLHVRELARTARIPRGDGPVLELPYEPCDLGSIPVPFEGSATAFAASLEQTYTDGICVVQDGRVVFEHYVAGMHPTDTHLLMSVSKSLTATLIGVLAGEGVLDPSADVTDYIGALRGTAWEGCTLQHLLDMRAGTRFDEEDYDDPDSDGVLIDQISGYRTHRRPDRPADTYAWIVGLDNDREHGSAFKYRSILTDVLAWAAAEATGMRFPDLYADRIWSRIGAERDAEIIVDAAGFAAAEGGFCTTLRDLARFGLMHLQGGEIGGRRVVPAAWIDRLLVRDDELIAAFDDDSFPGRPDAFYHDAWWVWDGAAGIYSGYGINGQQLLVHHPSRSVIARFSTWPRRWDDRLSDFVYAANVAVLEHLSG
ncbi:MAG: serine hydrolase domain-containing protein [Solirubrobacteraceae bacterium]